MGAPRLSIVHVCRTGWPAVGGLESAVGGLAREQAAAGHRVSVVTLDRAADGVRLHPCTQDSVRWQRLAPRGPRRYRWAAGLPAAVRGSDLAHVHGLDGLADVLVATRRLHGVPVGISTHGGYLHTPRHARLKALWLRTVTRSTFGGADAVWFTSEADRERLAPAARSGSVLSNGVDIGRLSGVPRRPEPGRWLVVGRLDVHKGLDDLLAALAALARIDRRPFEVDMVGPEAVPGYQSRLRSQIRRGGLEHRVRLCGPLPLDALRDRVARAELALFPSRYEGFGVALVEAMGAGVPVLASEIAAHRSHVQRGVNGHLVDFRDALRAATRLSALHGADHGAVAAEGMLAASRYAWPAVLAAHDRAYRALVPR